MKRILDILALFMMTWLGLSACSSDDDEIKEDMLNVPTTTINVSDAAQDATLEFTTSGDISVNLSDRSWCKYEETGFAPISKVFHFHFTFHIQENPNKAARSTVFTIVCGEKTQRVTITQAASTKPDPEPEVPDQPEIPSDGSVAFARSMALGWNLGNQMDAHNNGVAGETAWGNKKCTQATMDAVKAAGITTVRIPVTWLGKVGAAPDYRIDATWLDRVAEIVGYAKNAGLKAIINIHHDGADSKHWLNIKQAAKDAALNTEITAQIKAMWTQIAEKFKDEGEYLVFEAFNEIQDGGWGWGDNRNDGGKQYATLDGWNQTFVDAVRATGGNNANRYLGIPAYNTNLDIAVEHFVLPADPASDRLLLSIHNYDPYKYTLEAEYGEWGHSGATGKKPAESEKLLTDAFKKVKDKFQSKGLGVYIGEFGCVNRSSERERKFQKYYLEYFCKAAHDNGIPTILWDNGSTKTGRECHGYFDHATGAYVGYAEEVVAVMVKAWTNEDSSYTLQSVYDNAPN